MDGHDAVVHFAAESHVDRSIEDGSKFVRTNCIGTNVLCDVANTVGVGKFLHISTDEVYGSIEEGSFVETDILAPRSPYSAAKAGSDLIALSLLHHLRPAGRRHPLLEQLRPVPVPREGHPAVHHQPARRQAGAAVRRRSATCATGSTSRITTSPPTSCCEPGDARRDLQHRCGQRDHQRRPHTSAAGADAAATSRSSGPSRIGSDTIDATRSTSTRSARSAGRSRAPSTTRSPRPSSGTATTATGGSR